MASGSRAGRIARGRVRSLSTSPPSLCARSQFVPATTRPGRRRDQGHTRATLGYDVYGRRGWAATAVERYGQDGNALLLRLLARLLDQQKYPETPAELRK